MALTTRSSMMNHGDKRYLSKHFSKLSVYDEKTKVYMCTTNSSMTNAAGL